MKHENSYQENMKRSGKSQEKAQEEYGRELIARMVLDDAMYKWKKEKLEREIDEALEQRDQSRFMSLTTAYKELVGSSKR